MTRECPVYYNKIELTRLLRRISLLFLIVFVCASAFCGCVSGDDWIDYIGEDAFTSKNITYYGSNNTFVIHTNCGLAWVAKDIKNKHNASCTIILDKDIDLYGHNWFPIGFRDNGKGVENRFAGKFDGNGKIISNLTINNPEGTYLGFFGLTNNADITNVTLDNVNVTGDRSVGGLIGNYGVNDGKNHYIKNCNVTGDVKVTGKRSVGGLIGNYGFWTDDITHTRITIENCSATGNVSSPGNDVGGFIGQNVVAKGTITIKNCYATGNVSGNKNVSGFIGTNYFYSNIGSCTIKNCYATGKVYGNTNVGGLIGNRYNNAIGGKLDINNCTALNQYVNGTSNVGRIVGDNTNTNAADNYAWEGMKNGEKFFTTDTELNKKNGENVSSMQAWGNITFYQDNLKWDFIRNWTIIENDNNENEYPLPYLKSLGKDDSLRAKVLYLKPVNVTFNNSSGKGIMYDQVFSKGVPQKLYQNIFTRTGYTFDGWSNTQNGAKLYEDKQSIPVTEDITLYAVWKGNITNITLYFNNTTSFPSVNQTVKISFDSDTFNPSLTTPAKPGYTFLGYNNSTESSSVQVINNTLKLVQNAEGYTLAGKWNNTSDNVELWAVWKPNITNITLKFENGSLAPNDKQVVNITYDNGTFSEPLSPLNYPGYTFKGYFNESIGGVLVINDKLELVPNAVNYTSAGCWINDTRDIELWAVWEKIPETTPTSSSGSSSDHSTTYYGWVIYTVYFDSCGGSPVDNQTDLRYGERVKEPDDPIKDGFIFDAWYTKDDYRWDFKNDIVNDTITLYAGWNAVEVQPTAEPPAEEQPCFSGWFWIILLIIAGVILILVIINIKRRLKFTIETGTDVIIISLIIKKRRNKKKDKDYDMLS